MNKLTVIEVPDKALYDAFMKETRPIGIFSQDEKQFVDFQKGWNAALDWVNRRHQN